MILTSSLPLIFCLIGQAPPSPEHPEESAWRLDFMKKSLAAYQWSGTLLAQTAAPPPDEKNCTTEAPDDPGARLEIMKRAMAAYQVRSADDRGMTYRLLTEPILRFTNSVGNTRDGAIFLWLDAGDRPVAAAQVSALRDGRWIQELSSLSTGPLTATSTTGHE